MSIPTRVKQIIAVTLGIVLLVATVVAITRDYSASTNIAVPENNTDQSEKADNKPVAEDKKDTTTPASEKVDEKTTPATEGTSNNKTTENKESDKTVVVTNNFVFTAKPGDNYTDFARDAIREYAVKNKLDISEERIQQTAATLAYQAGSPFLEVGQVVTITTNDISLVLGNKPEDTTPIADTTTPKKDTPEVPSKTSYSYTAEAGDSYVLLARKAIDEYSKSTNTALNPEQRIAAETFIISDAGFPGLEVGQVVTFSKDSVKNAVNKATGLSASQLALWQPYVALAGL
ncbi:hypothetical protein KDA11_02420 [Candidatus Saccharibacteria bacterium]|nr:hypothetical protein [Candidatus Saccharibacteria bacterium]